MINLQKALQADLDEAASAAATREAEHAKLKKQIIPLVVTSRPDLSLGEAFAEADRHIDKHLDEKERAVNAATAATMKAIAERRQETEPTPYEKLREIAREIEHRTGAHADAAMQSAIEANPDLFEQWQSSLPKPTFPKHR